MASRKRPRSSTASSDVSLLVDAATAGADDELRTNIAKLWEQQMMCDVCVVVGSREFQAHRLVLVLARFGSLRS